MWLVSEIDPSKIKTFLIYFCLLPYFHNQRKPTFLGIIFVFIQWCKSYSNVVHSAAKKEKEKPLEGRFKTTMFSSVYSTYFSFQIDNEILPHLATRA